MVSTKRHQEGTHCVNLASLRMLLVQCCFRKGKPTWNLQVCGIFTPLPCLLGQCNLIQEKPQLRVQQSSVLYLRSPTCITSNKMNLYFSVPLDIDTGCWRANLVTQMPVQSCWEPSRLFAVLGCFRSQQTFLAHSIESHMYVCQIGAQV